MGPSVSSVTFASRAADLLIGGLARCARDVVALGSPPRCAGCGLPGSSVCAGCHAPLAGVPWCHRPSPAPSRWPRTHIVTEYTGSTRVLLAAWKERGRRDVAPFLALSLATAIEAAIGPGDHVAAIVPIPASRASRRRRGEDAWLRVATLATRYVNRGGRRARVERVLQLARQPRDQSTLSSGQRRENLRHAMVCTHVPEGVIVLVDDIVTTGSTMGEAARALAAAGAGSVAGAAIAATFRARGRVTPAD